MNEEVKKLDHTTTTFCFVRKRTTQSVFGLLNLHLILSDKGITRRGVFSLLLLCMSFKFFNLSFNFPTLLLFIMLHLDCLFHYDIKQYFV